MYHRFRKWAGDGSLRKACTQLLQSKRRLLDLTSMQLGGRQMLCKKGGEHPGQESRESLQQPVPPRQQRAAACLHQPVSGAHHDLFEIEEVFRVLCSLLEEAGVEREGLFFNADTGFASEGFRRLCSEMKIEANIVFNPRKGESGGEYVHFDEELFKNRTVIENANAWLDSFKALLIRF